MMLMIHTSLSLGLIALIMGATFLLYVKSHDKFKNAWTLFVGYFVVIISALSVLCTLYFFALKPSHTMTNLHHKEMPSEYK